MMQAGQLNSKQLNHVPCEHPMTLIRLLESVQNPFKRIRVVYNVVKNGIMDFIQQIKVGGLFNHPDLKI